MRVLRLLALTLIASLFPLFGQLALEQKEQDFKNLAALYAKTYAPAEWKKLMFGFDVMNISPWLDLVRTSKTDIEFIEICLRYVAALRDTHTAFFTNSSFIADSGLVVDLYEGRVLIEGINRLALPTSRFPFRVGDEVLAIDGKPVSQIINDFLPLVSDANDRKRRRATVDLLTFRPQQMIPRAVELGSTSVFQIRLQDGTSSSYTIPWTKTGYPLTQFGPVDSPKIAQAPRSAATAAEDALQPLAELRNLAVAPNANQVHRSAIAARTEDEKARGEEPTTEGALTGYGSRTPIFTIPDNFVVRRGRVSADNFFTATYEVAGKRIGYLRIPSFAPSSTSTALTELVNEIVFFSANTDGLVVDVTRNPGGDLCYLGNVLSLLNPVRITAIGAQIRPTLRYINLFTSTVEFYQAIGADAATIDGWTKSLEALKQAYAANRGLSTPVALCGPTLDIDPARTTTGLLAYSKPLIVLTDDFSTSAGDAFAAVMQDSRRGPIVGMPTAGAGGTVIGALTTGNYSESFSTTTTSLLTRKAPVAYPGLPVTAYIENIGVWPDIYLDYMTSQNLLNGGRTFVNDFTGAILTQILKAAQ